MEGKVLSQVFGVFFYLSTSWEGRGLPLPACRGFQRAGVSRDLRLSKETMNKKEALALRGRVL